MFERPFEGFACLVYTARSVVCIPQRQSETRQLVVVVRRTQIELFRLFQEGHGLVRASFRSQAVAVRHARRIR